MKIKNLFPAFAAALTLVACSEEKFDLQTPDVSPEDLVQGVAYTVTTNPETNQVTLQSLMGDKYVTSWVTPNGNVKSQNYTFSLPFSGEYEVKYGVMTRGGMVYGEPYKFSLSNNNFSLLSDEIWTNLAGGVDENGNGNPKTWVPMNKKYGTYYGSSPITYMDPNNVKNDGSGETDLKIGSENWSENWDPGFQSWLIDSDDPYMNSEMTLYLDPQKGQVINVKRYTADGMSEYTSTFNLNISDPQRPVISVNNSNGLLHAAWGDGVCSNYNLDIKIIECTPYVLQFATMRTNSEGPWWIVWNFVSKELRDGVVELPAEGPELVEVASPTLPTYDNLAETLFTIVGDASYYATETTLLMNDEVPYDAMFWNGANGGSWDWIGGYGSSWEPAYPDGADFSMVLSRRIADDKTVYVASIESADVDSVQTANFTIGENSIVFDKSVVLLDYDGQLIEGKEFFVLKCSPDDEQVILGIPDGTDSNGKINRYKCVNLSIKPISGATGPTVIAVDNAKLNCYVEAGDHYRIELFNPWVSYDYPIDITKVRMKKEQKMTINFKISGVNWKEGAQPRVLFAHNIDAIGFDWPSKGAGFDQPHTIFNVATGEGTATLTNTTGSTVKFDNSCVTLCIEITGLVDGPLTEDGILDPDQVTSEVTSFTIE